MSVKLVDVGYVLRVDTVKSGYLYLVDGKNSVYRIFSKRYFAVESFVFIYANGDRLFISDK